MKKLTIFYLLIFAACNHGKDETVGLTGTYIAYHEHEFGKTNDTLVVSKVNGGQNIYQINRNAGVVRTADGKVFPKRLVKETCMARYIDENKMLEDLKTGKTYVWNSQQQLLISGSTQFRKK